MHRPKKPEEQRIPMESLVRKALRKTPHSISHKPKGFITPYPNDILPGVKKEIERYIVSVGSKSKVPIISKPRTPNYRKDPSGALRIIVGMVGVDGGYKQNAEVLDGIDYMTSYRKSRGDIRIRSLTCNVKKRNDENYVYRELDNVGEVRSKIESFVQEEASTAAFDKISFDIVSGSPNLISRGSVHLGGEDDQLNKDIFSFIDAEKIKEYGVKRVSINIISCNMSEKVKDLLMILKEKFLGSGIRVSLSFGNGYMYSTDTSVFISGEAHKELLSYHEPTRLQDHEAVMSSISTTPCSETDMSVKLLGPRGFVILNTKQKGIFVEDARFGHSRRTYTHKKVISHISEKDRRLKKQPKQTRIVMSFDLPY